MLQLVAHVLTALVVHGSVGASSGGDGAVEDDDDRPPVMGMNASCCRLADIVARSFERRGGLFGAAPGDARQAPSVDLLAGRELRMERLRLPRQACLLVRVRVHVMLSARACVEHSASLCMQPDGSLEGGLSELSGLLQGRRVTSSPTSAALHLEPMRAFGAPRPPPGAPEQERQASAGSSPCYGQWREASVPGRAAETFALLPERPLCPPHALLRNTRWSRRARRAAVAGADGGAGAPQVWRFTELEGYREDQDVATSEVHAVQTRGMRPGRLAFVSQGHGRISLTLVCAHGVTLLVRGLCAQ